MGDGWIFFGSTGITGEIVIGGAATSGRAFLPPPKPSHEARSSQPRFFGSAATGAGGSGATGVIGVAAAGFGGAGRTGAEVTFAPSSWANVSQLGFFGWSVIVFFRVS